MPKAYQADPACQADRTVSATAGFIDHFLCEVFLQHLRLVNNTLEYIHFLLQTGVTPCIVAWYSVKLPFSTLTQIGAW